MDADFGEKQMNRAGRMLMGLVLLGASTMAHAQSASSAAPADYADADRIFDEFRLDAQIPGLVYGIIADGRLVHVGTFGVQDTESKRPVTSETIFRVASMTKAFTALTVLSLRDEGKLRLDAPASEYVPELRGWKYPTMTRRRSGCATC